MQSALGALVQWSMVNLVRRKCEIFQRVDATETKVAAGEIISIHESTNT
jgi:hypothetical protein